MSSIMDGMRGRTVARANAARADATRAAYIPKENDPDDFRLYSWFQERGPIAVEETINWQEESR